MKPITYLTLSLYGTLIPTFRLSETQAISTTYIFWHSSRLNVRALTEISLANISYSCAPYSGSTQNLVISLSTSCIVFNKYMINAHSNHTCLAVPALHVIYLQTFFTNITGYATGVSTGMTIPMFATKINCLLMHHIPTPGNVHHIPTP